MAGPFAINIIVALLWMTLQGAYGLGDFVVGFVLGALLISFGRPDYGRRSWAVPAFVLNLLYQIVRSTVTVSRYVIQRHRPLTSGLVTVPLDVETPVEIALLASAITLTPGTISVDLQTDPSGRRLLIVHALQAGDPEALRQDIKGGFERQILAITRGGAPA